MKILPPAICIFFYRVSSSDSVVTADNGGEQAGRRGVEKDEGEKGEDMTLPDGGFWGWMVVLGKDKINIHVLLVRF